jgi:hypothetical protein
VPRASYASALGSLALRGSARRPCSGIPPPLPNGCLVFISFLDISSTVVQQNGGSFPIVAFDGVVSYSRFSKVSYAIHERPNFHRARPRVPDRHAKPVHAVESTFGICYLVPFLLTLLVLALEAGLVERKHAMQNAVVGLAPGLLLLAIPGGGGSDPYREFLATFLSAIGSPVYTALLGLLVFYAYAWWRGTRIAEWGLVGALLAACVIGRQTTDFATLSSGAWWPLVVLALAQLCLGLSRRSSARSFGGALAAIAAASLAFRGTQFFANFGATPVHLVLLAVLLVGFAFSDRFALILRKIGAVTLLSFGLVAAFLPQAAAVSAVMRIAYLALLSAIAFVCWVPAADRWYLVAGSLNAASLSLTGISSLQQPWARTVGTRGFQPLLWGLVCFVLAVWISARKGVLSKKIHAGFGSPDSASDRPDG